MHLMMGWRRCICLLDVVASQVGYAGNGRFKQLSQQTCYDKILFKLWYYVFYLTWNYTLEDLSCTHSLVWMCVCMCQVACSQMLTNSLMTSVSKAGVKLFVFSEKGRHSSASLGTLSPWLYISQKLHSCPVYLEAGLYHFN